MKTQPFGTIADEAQAEAAQAQLDRVQGEIDRRRAEYEDLGRHLGPALAADPRDPKARPEAARIQTRRAVLDREIVDLELTALALADALVRWAPLAEQRANEREALGLRRIAAEAREDEARLRAISLEWVAIANRQLVRRSAFLKGRAALAAKTGTDPCPGTPAPRVPRDLRIGDARLMKHAAAVLDRSLGKAVEVPPASWYVVDEPAAPVPILAPIMPAPRGLPDGRSFTVDEADVRNPIIRGA